MTPTNHILSRKTVVFQNTLPTLTTWAGDTKWWMPYKIKEGDTVYAAYTYSLPYFEDSTINKKVEECANKLNITYHLDHQDEDTQMHFAFDTYSTDHRLMDPNTPFVYLGKALNIVYDSSFFNAENRCLLKFYDVNKCAVRWFVDHEIKSRIAKGFVKTFNNSFKQQVKDYV